MLLRVGNETVNAYLLEAQDAWKQIVDNYRVEHPFLEPTVTLQVSSGSLEFSLKKHLQEGEMTCSHSPRRTDRQWVKYFHGLIINMILCLTLAISCTHSAMAQESQAGDQSQTAAEASKEAANPLSSVWLMQVQQNNSLIGMPANGGNGVQSNLQFQPLMSIKMNEDWSLVTRPVLQLVNTTPFQRSMGRNGIFSSK
jgi:hypothetical protein